ncbi:hypothetical protein RDWZM_001829 [Blomia tropicalis]|uniref:Uncharacterized protein n=1 Tax=Blomia tropicalis TaxID=40697 RepID=A0A9Q0RQY2_BLOTA|nr:hypothetical protein RDWZM_001829 [Blomia tropicalis]
MKVAQSSYVRKLKFVDSFIMDDSLLENNTIETFDMLQQNLAKNRLTLGQLIKYATESKIRILAVQEPYTINEASTGNLYVPRELGYTVYSINHDRPRAAIVADSRLPITYLNCLSNKDIYAVDLTIALLNLPP